MYRMKKLALVAALGLGLTVVAPLGNAMAGTVVEETKQAIHVLDDGIWYGEEDKTMEFLQGDDGVRLKLNKEVLKIQKIQIDGDSYTIAAYNDNDEPIIKKLKLDKEEKTLTDGKDIYSYGPYEKTTYEVDKELGSQLRSTDVMEDLWVNDKGDSLEISEFEIKVNGKKVDFNQVIFHNFPNNAATHLTYFENRKVDENGKLGQLIGGIGIVWNDESDLITFKDEMPTFFSQLNGTFHRASEENPSDDDREKAGDDLKEEPAGDDKNNSSKGDDKGEAPKDHKEKTVGKKTDSRKESTKGEDLPKRLPSAGDAASVLPLAGLFSSLGVALILRKRK